MILTVSFPRAKFKKAPPLLLKAAPFDLVLSLKNQSQNNYLIIYGISLEVGGYFDYVLSGASWPQIII